MVAPALRDRSLRKSLAPMVTEVFMVSEPSRAMLPRGQRRHTVVLFTSVWSPMPLVGLYWPAGQLVHCCAPQPEYWPAGLRWRGGEVARAGSQGTMEGGQRPPPLPCAGRQAGIAAFGKARAGIKHQAGLAHSPLLALGIRGSLVTEGARPALHAFVLKLVPFLAVVYTAGAGHSCCVLVNQASWRPIPTRASTAIIVWPGQGQGAFALCIKLTT